jgi:Domain of unknown function (DUF4387)
MTQLHELARLIRSKNAGPFELTVDVMFENQAAYERVVASEMLSTERMAALYQVDPSVVQSFHADVAMAIKISIPRPMASGSVTDTDIFGGQFHSPIVRLEIP